MTAEVTAYLFDSAQGCSWPLLASLLDCGCRGWLWCSGQGRRPIAGIMTPCLRLLALAFARPNSAGLRLISCRRSQWSAWGSPLTCASSRPGNGTAHSRQCCRSTGILRLTAARTRTVAPAPGLRADRRRRLRLRAPGRSLPGACCAPYRARAALGARRDTRPLLTAPAPAPVMAMPRPHLPCPSPRSAHQSATRSAALPATQRRNGSSTLT
jgi:hypothetical protein